MSALVLQASPDRRTRASLGSLQSDTAHAFPCLYPSWRCQYLLFANLYLAHARVWALPCKSPILRTSLVTRAPQVLLLLLQGLSPTAASVLGPQPDPSVLPFVKVTGTELRQKEFWFKKAGEMKISSLYLLICVSAHYWVLMIICLLLFRSRDYFSFSGHSNGNGFFLSFNHLKNTTKT